MKYKLHKVVAFLYIGLLSLMVNAQAPKNPIPLLLGKKWNAFRTTLASDDKSDRFYQFETPESSNNIKVWTSIGTIINYKWSKSGARTPSLRLVIRYDPSTTEEVEYMTRMSTSKRLIFMRYVEKGRIPDMHDTLIILTPM